MEGLTSCEKNLSEVVGLLPAAGLGTRLGVLPCSKEILPLGRAEGPSEQKPGRPAVACEFLLSSLAGAGIRQAYIILRPGKWDIPAFLGDGGRYGMNLAYLMMGHPFGSPFSLDQAWPFVQNHRVALGFPDILFHPRDAYARLLQHQEEQRADVVLGLFPAGRPENSDMVAAEAKGRVRQIDIKPKISKLKYSWILAVWSPEFSRFLHEYLADVVERVKEEEDGLEQFAQQEFYVGSVFNAWMQTGRPIESVTFDDGRWMDIGTPEGLKRAMAEHRFYL